MGHNAVASGDYTEAMGNSAQALGTGDIALGASSTASGAGTYAAALGANALATGAGSAALGAASNAAGSLSTALGYGAKATTANSVALGSNSVANSTTLGTAGFQPAGGTMIQASTAAGGEVSVGKAGAERRITNVAAGYAATDAVNVSQLMAEDARVNLVNNNLSNLSNVVNNIPTNASLKYFHANSTLADSTVTGVNSVAAGPAAVASANNAVALGANSVADRANTVSVGSATAQRQIVNVGAGQQAADAVNVSQLSGVTQALGGGASVKADGSIAQPTYNVYGNTYSNVGDALGNISSATGNIVQSLKYIKFGPSGADQAQAGGNDSIALGGNAVASANGSVAIGRAAFATGLNSVAIGYGSQAGVANTFAVGNSFTPRRIVNVADGVNDTDAATVRQMNQMGSDLETQIANVIKPTTVLKSSALLGTSSDSDPATVAQLKSMTNALGGGATVAADGTVSAPAYVVHGATYSNVGDAVANIAKSTDGIGFGPGGTAGYAQASGTDSIAVGGAAFATASNAIAIGTGARATFSNSVAIGYGSAASAANTFAVGNVGSTRRIVNVADGINATDAATVGQVSSDIQAAIANLNLNGTTNSGLLKSAVHSTSLLGATPTSSLPPEQLIVSGPTDKGGQIEASGTDSMAIGLNSKADADYALATGVNVRTLGTGSVGVGQQIAIDGQNTVVIGTNVTAAADNALVIGNNSSTVVPGANGGIAIGNNVQVGGVNTLAIGTNILASGSNSVTLGYASADGGVANVVSVGSSKLQRRIINVAAGTQNTDAVNVSQLSGVTAALGGGATVNADGSIKKPTYTVQGTTATDVGTAISKLDGAVSNVSNNVTNLTQNFNNVVNGGGIKYFHASSTLADSSASGAESVAIGGGAIASGANSVALGSGSVASSGSLGVKGLAPDNAALTAGTAFGELSVGTSGKERRITNVAAGYNATDAVNVSQLMAEDVKVNNVSNNLSNLSNVVNNIGANVSMKYFHANSSLVDSTASGANAIAVGPQATAAGTNAIAVGYNASATSAESVALGSNSTTSAILSATAYNPGNATLSGTTAAGEVSVGNGSFNRRITNVAAGSAATDAVNVSQLMAENAKVNAEGTATAAALGSGSTYDPTTGNIGAPTYITGGSTYQNVGGAITNIDARLSNITSGTGDGIKYFHASSTLGDSSASGKDSVAIGGAATASTANSVALG
ncbi:beta strand repeat-containing protein, partial [Paraburkholderia steynii]|uniref:beta strand repeat-containing protein n=1 Tax=Paraburkholderia steynii TaxID=1245441 RepID=UPI003CC67BBC